MLAKEFYEGNSIGEHRYALGGGLSLLELIGTSRLIYEKWPRAKSPPLSVKSDTSLERPTAA